MTEANDVSGTLPEARTEGELLGVIGEGDETGFAIRIVTHQDGELSGRDERSSAIFDQEPVTVEETR